MNTPKLVSQIIVLVAIVALLFTTVSNALPKEMPSGMPFAFEFEEGATGIDVDPAELSVKLTMPNMKFSSSLPEDFKDVKIDVFFGLGDSKARLGGFDLGTIPANGSVSKTFEADTLPLMLFASSLPELKGDDGKINIPLILDIKFKYLDWMDTQLLDLGISMEVVGTASSGNINVEVDPVNHNKATATINATESGSMAAGLIKQFNAMVGDDAEITAGDAKFTIHSDTSGNMSVIAEGKYMSAADTLLKMYEDSGKLTFTYSGNEFTLEGDKAQAVINAFAAYYATPEA